MILTFKVLLNCQNTGNAGEASLYAPVSDAIVSRLPSCTFLNTVV